MNVRGAPRFRPQCLVERHAGGLILKKQRLCVVQCYRRGKQVCRVPHLRIDHPHGYAAQVQSRTVSEYLRVERRLAIGEGDRKASFAV